jgi:hypothetical protein
MRRMNFLCLSVLTVGELGTYNAAIDDGGAASGGWNNCLRASLI